MAQLLRFTEGGMQYGPDRIVFFTDFAEKDWPLTSSEPVTASGPWIGTALASGTTAFTDAVGGTVILSGAATTDNSGSQIQHDLGVWAAQASKDMAFYVRFKLSNATDSHFFAGIATTDTTAMDGADGTAALTGVVADAIGFFKADDAATLALVGDNASAITFTTSAGTLTDNTYVEMEFVYRATATAGSGTFYIYKDRVAIGQASTTALPTTTLALLLSQVSGTATGTVSATVDALWMAMDR